VDRFFLKSVRAAYFQWAIAARGAGRMRTRRGAHRIFAHAAVPQPAPILTPVMLDPRVCLL
jgi:hypothetical protein